MSGAARIARYALVAGLLLWGPSARAALIASYHFDEADGTVATDSAGDVDGTLEGMAIFAPAAGVSGGAVSIARSTNDRVNMGDHFEFTGTDPFSLQVWVRTTGTVGDIVVGRHVSTVVAGYWIGLNDTGDGPPNEAPGSFHLYQSDLPDLNSGDVGANDDQWHQLVAVRDADAGRIRLYFDGQRVPGPAATGDLRGLAATPAPFLVGALMAGGNISTSYDGLIDELRIWDTALSDDAVAYYYAHPAAVSVVACGDANEDTMLTATDALIALRTAVNAASCSTCVCDANSESAVTATDALLILQRSVGLQVQLVCPQC